MQCSEALVTEDSIWRQVTAKRTATIVGGLETGKKYAFRLAGIVDEGVPVFSEPVISKFVE